MRNVCLDKKRRGLIKLVVVGPRHRHRCLIANANQRCRKLHYEMHFNLAKGAKDAERLRRRLLQGTLMEARLHFWFSARLANWYLWHDRRRQSGGSRLQGEDTCTLHATALNCCPNLIKVAVYSLQFGKRFMNANGSRPRALPAPVLCGWTEVRTRMQGYNCIARTKRLAGEWK